MITDFSEMSVIPTRCADSGSDVRPSFGVRIGSLCKQLRRLSRLPSENPSKDHSKEGQMEGAKLLSVYSPRIVWAS